MGTDTYRVLLGGCGSMYHIIYVPSGLLYMAAAPFNYKGDQKNQRSFLKKIQGENVPDQQKSRDPERNFRAWANP